MTSKTYYAHSAGNLPYEHWQTMQSHARNVGGMAAGFAAYFCAQEIARATGLLHDVGKYSPLFDKRLHGDPKRVDHSTAGAKIAVERWGVRLGKVMALRGTMPGWQTAQARATGAALCSSGWTGSLVRIFPSLMKFGGRKSICPKRCLLRR